MRPYAPTSGGARATGADASARPTASVFRARRPLRQLLAESCSKAGEWLGRQDSNLGSRDQNPLPYHLATPHRIREYRNRKEEAPRCAPDGRAGEAGTASKRHRKRRRRTWLRPTAFEYRNRKEEAPRCAPDGRAGEAGTASKRHRKRRRRTWLRPTAFEYRNRNERSPRCAPDALGYAAPLPSMGTARSTHRAVIQTLCSPHRRVDYSVR